MNKLCFFSFISILVFCSQAHASDARQVCKNYYWKMHLGACMSRYDAAFKRLNDNTFYKSVSESCIDNTRLVDRLAHLNDYIGAEKCAVREQRRIEEQEERQAAAARDRAASEYLNEASKTERAYRKKYYNK